MSYRFRPAIIDSDNWINRYINFATACTDAPHEYHEAYGAFLLSAATQGLKLQLQSVPKGMRTNLYMLIYGVSSKMRKSTAMLLAKEVQELAFSGVRLPENFTPGGLEEEIAERNGSPSMLFVDEFSGVLDKMYHLTWMAQLRSFLLTMYSEEKWDYIRRAKNNKKDIINISESHLCIAGNVTPTVSRKLKEDDIEDGFLARFSVIMPTNKPPRRRLFELHTGDPRILRAVAADLREIRAVCAKLVGVEGNVSISPEGLLMLDVFQEEMENQGAKGTNAETAEIMLERISDMAIKLSLIVAAGRTGSFGSRGLKVVDEDVMSAIALARRWAEYAVKFTQTINRNEADKHIRSCVRYLRVAKDNMLPRFEIARRLRVPTRLMDEVETTMIERDMIRLADVKLSEKTHRFTLMWMLNKDQDTELIDFEEEKLTKEVDDD